MAKVLLVEDDSNLREIYSARLQAEGYEVATAGDGEEGLAVAVKERPDLIIADVMMPKISGFDMLDILRSTPETKDVKVIVMTALSQEEDRQRGEALGADRYFVKSQVVLEDLVATVKELLGGQPAAAASATTDDAQTDDNNSPVVSTPAPSNQPAQDSAQQPAPTSTGADLDQEVADFAAKDPLMTGTPPSVATSDEQNSQPSSEEPSKQA